MRPPLSVTGTRWTRWTPLSNFSRANTPWPVTDGDDFLVAAELGGAGRDQLDPPALLFGIALVHAEQVAGEQRRLVAAGAGADFEHRRRARRRHRAAAARAPARARPRAAARRSSAIPPPPSRAFRHRPRPRPSRRATSSSARSRRTSAAALRDRLDLGIILGQLDELLGREIAAPPSPAATPRAAPRSAAIRSAEMRVIAPAIAAASRSTATGCCSPDRRRSFEHRLAAHRRSVVADDRPRSGAPDRRFVARSSAS